MHSPFTQFHQWLEAAKSHPEIIEPTAMTLATVSADAKPSARIVLLKEFSDDGFVFYTNSLSRKGVEIAKNPHVALIFYWMPLKRQIRIEGTTSFVSDEEADAYFNSRDRGKQIGAWASAQSQHLDNRATLLSRVEAIGQQYEGKAIPRPPHWRGYLITPHMIEFWQEASFRLHERLIFTRTAHGWESHTLYP